MQLFEEFRSRLAFFVFAGGQKQEIVLLGQHDEPLAGRRHDDLNGLVHLTTPTDKLLFV